MDYSLATFDGAHFAHIVTRDDHRRLQRIANGWRRYGMQRRHYRQSTIVVSPLVAIDA